MIKRERYLSRIRPFYESDLVKIITGVRRCGKSVILQQIKEELQAAGKPCLSLDFDLRSVRSKVGNVDALVDFVEKAIGNASGKLYVFLDEIQNVDSWSEACRSLRLRNCSLFITGSNSKLLSKEFTKELSGRYVAFRIRPFVYREAKEYALQLGKTYSIGEYLTWGGFPAAIAQPDAESRIRYLQDLNDTIIYNDLENRCRIRKRDVFERMVDYLLISNARIFSAKSVADYLKGRHVEVSVPTVIRYLGYLEEAYVVEALPIYSTKAKARLNYYAKLYDEDVSLHSIRHLEDRYDLTHNLENVVLNELLFLGYSVSVYRIGDKEIDFRAAKDTKTYLVQVAYSVVEESTYQRKFSAFNGLDNSMKKILITNDEVDFSTSTVVHYQLKDFLFMDEL